MSSRRNLHKESDFGSEPLLESQRSAKFNNNNNNGGLNNSNNNELSIPASHASFKSRPRMRRGVRKSDVDEDSGSSNFENRKRRVAAYCTSENYDMEPLLAHLEKHPNREPVLYRDVVHVKDSNWDFFVFPYGCVIFWGLTMTTEREILHDLEQFRINPQNEAEYDDFEFWVGTSTKINSTGIQIDDNDPLKKLSISHGIAQSVKLSVFESNIDELIEATRPLPQELSIHGRINLSRKEISQLMGRLFIQRSLVNLQSNILDVPDFFWEHDEYEQYYNMVSSYLDKTQRVDVLNKRLGVVEELLEMLRSELHTKNDTKLEWIIIILIVVEVLLEAVDVLLVTVKFED